jgi:putative component of toxin-antitoxin plasmid stabilization module
MHNGLWRGWRTATRLEQNNAAVQLPQGGLQRVEDVGDRHLEILRLGAVELQVELRHVGAEGRIGPADARILLSGGDKGSQKRDIKRAKELAKEL